MKHHTLLKEALRDIWKSRTRFFSILGIVALGVGFFAGVKATCPDMKLTMQQYYEQTALADIHLASTYGFNDNDIEAVRDAGGIRSLMPAYSVDAFLDTGERADTIVKVLSIKTSETGEDENELNQPVLKEGRLPEKPGECVVEKNIHSPEEFEIGATFKLQAGKVKDDILDTLTTDTFTIVGVVESSSFIAFDRGKAQIGDGEIDCFIMIPEQDFDLEVYTDLYMTMDSTAGLDPFEQPYKDAVKAAVSEFEQVATVREQERYDEILEEARQKLDDGKQELADGKAEAAQELADAQQKIDDAQTELTDGQATLTEKRREYNTQIAAAQKKLDDARAQTEDGEAQYQQGLTEYQAGVKQYEDGLAQFNQQKPGAEAQIAQLKAQAEGLRAQIAAGATQLIPMLEQVEQGIAQAQCGLDAAQQKLDESKAQLDAAKGQLDASRTQLDAAMAQIESGQAELNAQKKSGAKALDDAQAKLDDGQTKLDDAKREYEEGKAESDQKIADAQQELDDAESELADVKKPVWYVWDRDNNPGYTSYGEDADKIDAIASVFPLFFILVAALVCLTTMTRMVEEQRTQVGTLKALGYSGRSIMAKYLWYAIAASIIGSVVGLLIGFSVFPKIIIDAYNLRYFLPEGLTPFRWDYALWCTVVSIAVTGLSAWSAVYKELREHPAQLMRPKAPPSGKRVFLEKWTGLWSKLNFTTKVTIRNLFRYKKRVLMTVIGIAGCTALMLTGFGLQHAIGSIVDKQFGEIFVYDALGALDDETTADDLVTIQQRVAETPGVKSEMLVYYKGMDASVTGDKKVSVTTFVPSEPQAIDNYINLRTREGHETLTLSNDGAIVNEKLAKLLKLQEGDLFTLTDADGNTAQAKIAGITENYAMNYVYMTPDYYAQMFGEKPVNNMFAMDMVEGTDLFALSETLLTYDHVQGLSYASDTTEQFADMVDSMGSIMLVIIVSAGLLAFIVMYNLVNINVTERMRELATIKVLGFYNKEVSAYIYRENTISAVIGMLVGLFAGIFLERFVISTAEVDIVMFAPDIPFTAFLYAGALTLAFAFIVNFVLHFKLKKIDMVESMKSIE